MRLTAAAVLLALVAPGPRPEKFVGAMQWQSPPLAVMSTTETLLDGKPTPWGDIPDETDLIRLDVDVERNVILKAHYKSRKEI